MKSCLNQGVVGVFMFYNLIILLPLVFVILPSEFEEGKWVIFFIALGNLVKLSTGLNIQIISFSKYYKTNSILMVLYVLLMILVNLITIPKLGITGAAIGSFVASVIYFLSASIFLSSRFEFKLINPELFHPYIIASSIGLPLLLISNALSISYISIILSGLFSFIVGYLFYKRRVSPDLMHQIDKYLGK
jgi:O-antigen/teichoic acid export membrane protein